MEIDYSSLECINFVVVPITTLSLYQIDLQINKELDLTYTSITWPNNILFRYQLIYFGLGLVFFGLYFLGFQILNKDPWTVIMNNTSAKTPPFALVIYEGLLIGWTATVIVSVKAFPFVHGTIDNFVKKVFLKDFEQNIEIAHHSGMSIFANNMIRQYDKKNSPHELNLEILGNKLITYFEESNNYTPEIQALIKDVSEAKTLHSGVMQILHKNSPAKFKAILF